MQGASGKMKTNLELSADQKDHKYCRVSLTPFESDSR